MSAPPSLPEWASEQKAARPKINGHAAYPVGPHNLDYVREQLHSIPPDVGYDDWYRVLAGIHHESSGSAEGFALADAWSAKGSKYRGTADVEQHWKSFRRGKGITGATLAKIARDHGADLSAMAKRQHGDLPVGKNTRSTNSIKRDTDNTAALSTKGKKGEGASQKTQATALLELADAADIAPFCTRDGTAYVDVSLDGHRETHAAASASLRKLLRRLYFQETGGAANDDAVRQVVGVIEAHALFGGETREVYLRVATVGPRIYIDLCDSEWRAIEIDDNGWRIVDRPPVRFRRTRGMQPLPVPQRGGRVEELKDILPIDDHEYVLAVAWLLMAMRGEAGCPILVLTGEQGTGKSVAARVLRGLVDPNAAPLRGPPRDQDQLIVMAANSYVLVLDNLSGINAEVSDGLCRISTGGGASKRALFTDGEEYTFDGHRPVITNGIGDLAVRGDLADRTVAIRLNVIPEDKRIPERELLEKYEAARPRIIGALLDVIAHGVLSLPHTRLNGYPRMANFAQWVSACEGAIWSAGMFMAAYDLNRGDAVEVVLDADPIATALQQHMSGRDDHMTTAAGLLTELGTLVGEAARRSRQWPGNPRALSGQLRRLAPALRGAGLFLDLDRRGHGGRRLISITRGDRNGTS